VRIDRATHQVSVAVEGGDLLMSALRVVGDAGVDVEDIALRQPNLDEVFLALTGQDALAGTAEAVAS
jgi:ABC-2 type transport system ATP-binding protein